MPKLQKTNNEAKAYDLKKPFASLNSKHVPDGQYKTYNSAKPLVVWLKPSIAAGQTGSGPQADEFTYVFGGSLSNEAVATTEFERNFNYFDLDGTNDHIYIDESNDASFPGTLFDLGSGTVDYPFTVSAWVKFDAVNAIQGILSRKETFALWLNTSGKIKFKISDTADTVNATITAADAMLANRWYHIAASYNPKAGSGGDAATHGLKLYINGKLVETTASQDSGFVAIDDENDLFRFGTAYLYSGGWAYRYLNGKLGDCAFWRSALHDEEIHAVYAATVGGMIDSWQSGITSLPPRIRIRQKDNATGSYPTIVRTGPAKQSGRYNTSFNDNITIDYGRKYHSNFGLTRQNRYAGVFHYAKMPVGTQSINSDFIFSDGMEIRTESIVGDQGETFNDGALVFVGADTADNGCGAHSAGQRWVRTKNKVRNPEIEFDLLQGPYNKVTSILGAGLRLEQGVAGVDNLHIQISEDASSGSWTTIETFNITPGFGYLSLVPILSIGSIGKTITLPETSAPGPMSQKARARVHLGMHDFKKGPTNPYYIRIAQTSISDESLASWSIGKLKIKDSNTHLSFPIMVPTGSIVGEKIKNAIVAKPNILPEISAHARSMSGISDVHIEFTKGQDIEPFNDHYVIEEPNNLFFDVGTSQSEIEGFSAPLRDKIKLSYDLTPNHTHRSDYFGQITTGSTTTLVPDDVIGTDGSQTNQHLGEKANHQQLMVYWNPGKRKWERFGIGVHPNLAQKSGDATTTFVDMNRMVKETCLGFGPIGALTTGSSVSALTNAALYPLEKIATSTRPISQFGFPASGRYHATGSQTIKARDLGINHPFLLEKCVLETGMLLEFSTSTVETVDPSKAYAPRHHGDNDVDPNDHYTDGSNVVTLSAETKIAIPTFFMLKQSKGAHNTNSFGVWPSRWNLGVTGIYNILGAARAEEVIPGYFRKDQHDSGASQYVDTVRELITYGQISVVTDGADGGALRSVASYEELLEAGLRKDANVRYVGDHPGLSDVPLSSITGSFIIPFPCRATSPYPLLHRYRAYAFGGFAATGAATTVGVSNETPVDVILGLEYGTRARPSVMNGARVSSNAKFWQNIGSPPNSLPQGYVPIQNSMFLQDPGRSGYDPDAPVEIAEILSAYTSLSRTRFPSARSLINGVGAAAIEAGTITFPYPKNDEAYSYEEQLPTLDSLDQHAPYILMPDDDIILGWQYPCPEDPTAMPGSTGEASGANSQPLLNRMALSGSATLHLYGSMIKEGKAYQHGNALNQHLTSNAVHEIIGNDPVVDQFFIEERTAYSGSFTDMFKQQIISGSGNFGVASGIITITDGGYAGTNASSLSGGTFTIYEDGVPHVFTFSASTTSNANNIIGTSGVGSTTALANDIVSSINDSSATTYNKITAKRQTTTTVSYTHHRPGADLNLSASGPDGKAQYLIVSHTTGGITFSTQNDPVSRITHMNKTRGGNSASTDIPGIGSCVNAAWHRANSHFGSPFDMANNAAVAYRQLRHPRGGMANRVMTKYNSTAHPYGGSAKGPCYAKTGSFTRFFSMYDQARVFYDSQHTYGTMFSQGFVVERPGIPSSSFHIDNHNSNGRDKKVHVATSTDIYSGSRGRAVWSDSSYGTMQTMNPLYGDSKPTPLRPKYYYSMNHFGHYADLLRQGLDSRCYISMKGAFLGRRTPARGLTVRSPVKIEFVTGSVDSTPGIKSFYAINRPNSLFYVTQSNSTTNTLFPFVEKGVVVYTRSNVSKTSTSSFGFAEDGPMPGPSAAGGGAVSEFVIGAEASFVLADASAFGREPVPSDSRLKTNILRDGATQSGIPLYTFAYKKDTSNTLYRGVIAQDIVQTHPEAVSLDSNGYYNVYYNLIDADFEIVG